ncbi:serine carboxypeptidase [Dichomitus squalens]|uniref:Carboxypeptidase n=1 Tax=Dichomitus squalens TaxID=114155 RepID=A0A4Q9MZV2_9APHY|nr:serine carboxypeptidase [Dichomitus squalens]
MLSGSSCRSDYPLPSHSTSKGSGMWLATFALLATPTVVIGLVNSALLDVRASDRAPSQLRLVENSGECETIPGVNQASGYADIDANNSMWFWFFEAREHPETAPLTLWLQGGPGGSGLVGLYQEHGPCRINNDSSTVSFNPFSWNNASNMIYIDQPIGTGFSNGDRQLNNSVAAAADVWQVLQILFADARFEEFQYNDFGVWTESYGGHYGPIFAQYFLDQNAAIANGSIRGVPINMKVLGIGDGLTDPLIQYESYLTYAQSNPYFPTTTNDTIQSATDFWNQQGGCKDMIHQCYDSLDPTTCSSAQNLCDALITHRLAGNQDEDYILADFSDTYPPDITQYANNTTRKQHIGAVGDFEEVNSEVLFEFQGEWMQNSRPMLEAVVDAGIRTVLYVGDADYLFNYFGVEAMLDQMQTRFSTEWAEQQFSNFTVHGESAGLFKNAGTLSYVRVFGAGHEVAAYRFGTLGSGEAAYQIFSQIVGNNPLSAT